MLRKTVILLLSSCLLSCGAINGPEEGKAAVGAGNPDTLNGKHHWNESAVSNGASLNLLISQDIKTTFTAAYLDADGKNPVEAMAAMWDTAETSYTFFPTTLGDTTNKAYPALSSYYDSEMGIYKSTSWFSSIDSGVLAITQYFAVRRNAGTPSEYLEYVHADIILNYKDYTFTLDDPGAAGSYDFHSVIIHELGHFLGLEHYTTGNPVMQPSLNANTVRRALSVYDQTAISYNYSQAGSSSIVSGENAITSTPYSKIYEKSVSAPEGIGGEGEIVMGIFELRADGKCKHSVNGKLQSIH